MTRQVAIPPAVLVDGGVEMVVRFGWRWAADDAGEFVRVVMTDDGPGGVEVARMVVGRTDDRTGCVLRAVVVTEALTRLADYQEELNRTPSGSTVVGRHQSPAG